MAHLRPQTNLPAHDEPACFAAPLGPTTARREMLKAKLQKDKYMTKPLSEIVASETEVCAWGWWWCV